jgi:hypothetical protein
MSDPLESLFRETREPPPDVIHLPDQSPRAPKRRRSGSEKRQRSTGIRVRVTPGQQEQLKADAAAAGMSVAAYLLSGRLGDDAAPGPRRWRRHLPAISVQALARNNAELNKIGSNLNQAVHALNEMALAGRRLDAAAHLTRPIQRMLEALNIVLAENRQALGHDREG